LVANLRNFEARRNCNKIYWKRVQAGLRIKKCLWQRARELKLTGELEKLLSGEIKPKRT